MHNQIKISNSLKFILISFMLFLGNVAFADDVYVSTKAELVDAVASASTPTNILVASGNYSGETIKLDGNTAPVTIRSETNSEAHFQSTIEIHGDNITIQKMSFNGAAGGIDVYGNDCKVLGNTWDNSGKTDWLKVKYSAYRTEVGYNLFQNRSSVPDGSQVISQTLIEMPSTPYATHYHHNHFKNIASSTARTEIILIWSRGQEANPPAPDNHIIHEYNLYENAVGDGKAIDIKTNGSISRFNTFIGQSGYIKQRHGKRGIIDSNVWLGGSGGITANDRDHRITNNYIVGSSSTSVRGIQCYYGKTYEESPYGYMQMFNTVIENNTLINCGTGLELGATGVTSTLPMVDTVIKDNKFINCGTLATHRGSIEHKNTTWTNNRYKGNGGIYASLMAEDNSLVATPPSWTLTQDDVGPHLAFAEPTVEPTVVVTAEPTVEPTGAFIMTYGSLK